MEWWAGNNVGKKFKEREELDQCKKKPTVETEFSTEGWEQTRKFYEWRSYKNTAEKQH
jgi:hypothetical protein